jgi:hypothetical protein
MRIVLALPFLAVSLIPTSAQGWSDLDRMQAATALGDLLGSETACGLTYDHEAINRYIDENIPADDMQFTSFLQMSATGTEYQMNDLSESRKTAHCRQIERVARSHGFIE